LGFRRKAGKFDFAALVVWIFLDLFSPL